VQQNKEQHVRMRRTVDEPPLLLPLPLLLCLLVNCQAQRIGEGYLQPHLQQQDHLTNDQVHLINDQDLPVHPVAAVIVLHPHPVVGEVHHHNHNPMLLACHGSANYHPSIHPCIHWRQGAWMCAHKRGRRRIYIGGMNSLLGAQYMSYVVCLLYIAG
jgi:hypothetical protein